MSIDTALGATFMIDDLNSSDISADSSRFNLDAWFTKEGESLYPASLAARVPFPRRQ